MTTKHTNARLSARRPVLGAALAALALAAATPTAAQAVDCANPATAAEKEVCADEELHTLDDMLSRYIAAAMPALYDGAKCLEADQRQWTQSVRDACGGGVQCQAQAFRKRLEQLDTLLTAVPPVTEAALPTGGPPHEVTGRLIWEQQDANNMGYAVRDEKGAVYVIVLDMDIGSSRTHDAVRTAIASSTSSTFTVRGTKSPDGGFAMDRCRFVWRVG